MKKKRNHRVHLILIIALPKHKESHSVQELPLNIEDSPQSEQEAPKTPTQSAIDNDPPFSANMLHASIAYHIALQYLGH